MLAVLVGGASWMTFSLSEDAAAMVEQFPDAARKVRQNIIISTAERPINLLEIIGASIVGGMETYVLRLLQRLPHDIFNVTCLCVSESHLTSQLRDIGCTVHTTSITDDPDWQSIQLGVSLLRAEAIE